MISNGQWIISSAERWETKVARTESTFNGYFPFLTRPVERSDVNKGIQIWGISFEEKKCMLWLLERSLGIERKKGKNGVLAQAQLDGRHFQLLSPPGQQQKFARFKMSDVTIGWKRFSELFFIDLFIEIGQSHFLQNMFSNRIRHAAPMVSQWWISATPKTKTRNF